MKDPPDIRLTLPAVAENLSVVRQAMTGIAQFAEIDPALLADVKMAVSEACSNAIQHAYDDERGVLEVDASVEGGRLLVSVRDHGSGMRPRIAHPESGSEALGLGLPLIAALSDGFEIRGGGEGGIEVRVAFTFASIPPGEGVPLDLIEAPAPPPSQAPEGAVVSIANGPLVAPVVSRVIAMIAARVNFPVDRLSDAVLVGDAISAHAPPYAAGARTCVAVNGEDDVLDLRVGPLVSEGGGRLLADGELPGVGSSFEQLASQIDVERGGENGDPGTSAQFEYLRLRLARAR